MAIDIVDFPINSMVDLSIAMLNCQRVYFFGGELNREIFVQSTHSFFFLINDLSGLGSQKNGIS